MPILDWSAVPQATLVEIVECDGVAWFRENPNPRILVWQFRWIEALALHAVMSRRSWRKWWKDELSWNTEYLSALEAAWLKDPLGVDPIIMVTRAGGARADIGDGWHRAAISVVHDMKRVPVITTELSDTPGCGCGDRSKELDRCVKHATTCDMCRYDVPEETRRPESR